MQTSIVLSHDNSINKNNLVKNLFENKICNKYIISRNNRNIFKIKKLIFPPIDNHKLTNILIDDESFKFITFHNIAQEITDIIMVNLTDFPCPTADIEFWKNKLLKERMKELVITEMTAGVGGNVLNFAKYFKYVNAIEINELRYKYLNNNIKIYQYDNVNCYHSDALILLLDHDDLNQDIIFFDPPWGGKDYKLYNNLKLTFNNSPIENICKKLLMRKTNKMLVLKLPNNYDFLFFENELCMYRISRHKLYKMTIVIVKNYD